MALMDRTGGIEFTADELAREANVARRTVFNHFDTVDDVVIAACGEILNPIIEPLESAGAGERAHRQAMFDEVVDVLRRPDLVPAMARIGRMLGSNLSDDLSPRQSMLFLRTVTGLGARASAALARRHPEVDRLGVDLLLSAFISGVITAHRHWVMATGWRDNAASRRLWAELVERLIDTIRSGHATARETPATHG